MEPGFFLDISDNTGNNLSYVVLPIKYWNKILVHRRLTNLVRSVVHSRIIDSSNLPHVWSHQKVSRFTIDMVKNYL